MESHLFRVRLDGSGLTRLTQQAGSHSISLSPTAEYYTDSFSSRDTPGIFTLHRADGRLIRRLGESIETREFQDLDLLDPVPFSFKSADGDYTLDGVLFKPAHFDPGRKYPLIMSVHGGPGS